MKSDVHIHMLTEVKDVEGTERYELHVEGTLQTKGDYTYLQYEESMKDAGRVHNLFKIGQDELIVVRKGVISMRQQFIIGEKTTGIYETQYGRLPFELETNYFQLNWDENLKSGKLSIQYTMTMEGSEKRNYDIVLNMREAGLHE